jgi:uncharacterized integral membrane protein
MTQQSPAPGSPGGAAYPPGAGDVTAAGGGRKSAGLSGGVVAMLASGALLVVFMVQNRDDVTLDFLWWSFTVPLWLFTIVVAVLGSIVWIGLGVLRRHRRRKARRDARDG